MNSRFSFFPVIITILVVTGSPWLLISCRGTPSDEITSPRTVHEANHPAHWGYGPDNGPAHWGGTESGMSAVRRRLEPVPY